jgi:hypothetical protein
VRASDRPVTAYGKPVGAYNYHQIGPVGQTIHHLSFLFRYAENEKTIEITAIGYMQVVLEDDELI